MRVKVSVLVKTLDRVFSDLVIVRATFRRPALRTTRQNNLAGCRLVAVLGTFRPAALFLRSN